MTKQTERAVINGEKFEDWETVSVKHAQRDAPPCATRRSRSQAMPPIRC